MEWGGCKEWKENRIIEEGRALNTRLIRKQQGRMQEIGKRRGQKSILAKVTHSFALNWYAVTVIVVATIAIAIAIANDNIQRWIWNLFGAQQYVPFDSVSACHTWMCVSVCCVWFIACMRCGILQPLAEPYYAWMMCVHVIVNVMHLYVLVDLLQVTHYKCAFVCACVVCHCTGGLQMKMRSLNRKITFSAVCM